MMEEDLGFLEVAGNTVTKANSEPSSRQQRKEIWKIQDGTMWLKTVFLKQQAFNVQFSGFVHVWIQILTQPSRSFLQDIKGKLQL